MGSSPIRSTNLLRGRAKAARWAHNPEAVGSNPTPATNGLLVQLARTSDLHSEGHRFESGTVHKMLL